MSDFKYLDNDGMEVQGNIIKDILTEKPGTVGASCARSDLIALEQVHQQKRIADHLLAVLELPALDEKAKLPVLNYGDLTDDMWVCLNHYPYKPMRVMNVNEAGSNVFLEDPNTRSGKWFTADEFNEAKYIRYG